MGCGSSQPANGVTVSLTKQNVMRMQQETSQSETATRSNSQYSPETEEPLPSCTAVEKHMSVDGKIRSHDVCDTTEAAPCVDPLEEEFPADPLAGRTFEIPEGSKEVELSKGMTYRGSWAHGIGETKYADGGHYIGEYKDGKADGLGIFTAKDGSQYRGSFKEGKAHGYGVYTFQDGSRYFGPYVDDRREGRGREIQSDGLEYIGEYMRGSKHGKGQLKAPNGETYEGDFAHGDIHGHGIYRWPDGRVYIGQWEKSRQNGNAEFRWPDGRVYKGQYKNGKLQGHGVLEWPDGRKYEGQWKNGLQNGIGKYWGARTWYREAQFLDGVRVKWLGETVVVDPEHPDSATPPQPETTGFNQ